MYNALALEPNYGSAYGAPPKEGYPCIQMGALDGPSGGAVSAVQNALTSQFGPLLQISSNHFSQKMTLGTFDAETDRLIRKFQDIQGLTPDGIVGPVTGQKLGLTFQKCSKVMASGAGGPIDPDPQPMSLYDKLMIHRYTNPVAFYSVAALLAGGISVGVYKGYKWVWG